MAGELKQEKSRQKTGWTKGGRTGTGKKPAEHQHPEGPAPKRMSEKLSACTRTQRSALQAHGAQINVSAAPLPVDVEVTEQCPRGCVARCQPPDSAVPEVGAAGHVHGQGTARTLPEVDEQGQRWQRPSCYLKRRRAGELRFKHQARGQTPAMGTSPCRLGAQGTGLPHASQPCFKEHISVIRNKGLRRKTPSIR